MDLVLVFSGLLGLAILAYVQLDDYDLGIAMLMAAGTAIRTISTAQVRAELAEARASGEYEAMNSEAMPTRTTPSARRPRQGRLAQRAVSLA